MEMENHESLGHQLRPSLPEGDFCWTGGGGGGGGKRENAENREIISCWQEHKDIKRRITKEQKNKNKDKIKLLFDRWNTSHRSLLPNVLTV
jgi:hypothetical protein